MPEPTVLPYGSWPSPLGAEAITAGATAVSSPQWDGGDLYWLESRPAEKGRLVVVQGHADVTPPPFSARTRVHEYGGGAWLVSGGAVIFSNFVDQRLYRHRPGEPPIPLTAEPDTPGGDRFSDGRVTADGQWLVCVRERHGDEVVNELVAVPLSGDREPVTLASGHDFYANPRISPDGGRLCWLTWDHPQMPWDGTELWAATLATDPTPSLSDIDCVTGGSTESIFQPDWSPSGVLHYVSDRTGWWNLYRHGEHASLIPRAAEFGMPAWVFGASTYGFLPDGRILVRWFEHGSDHLGVADDNQFRELALGYSVLSGPAIGPDHVALVAGGPTQEASIVTFPIASIDSEVRPTVVKRPRSLTLDEGLVSAAHPIEFPTGRNRTAHAYFYPPRNPAAVAPDGTRPPLVVMSHGGPTSATSPTLNLSTQFWTSRGIAVVDVNYGGSTGYGRAYRDRLRGEWGIVDVEDCINAARWLADQGEVDGDRLVIRGGSAGGYTTLCALTFHDVFAAGASYYGVADAARLATDTHKFESRYLDGLIGQWPEDAETYRQRSPIHFIDQLSRPLIIFQGLEDPVVPPSQAEMMVEALTARKVPYAYLAFEGEQHGFRQASTQRRCLEAELYFYSRILGFELADPVEPVDITFL